MSEVTKKIINENMDLLDLIANTLLEYETITKEQIDHLVEHGTMPVEEIEEASLEDLSLEELQELAKENEIDIKDKTKEELIKLLNKENKEN